MLVGVPKETFPGENRVALIPTAVTELQKIGMSVVIEAGAGALAGFPDADYSEKGATVGKDRAEIFKKANVIVQVRGGGANPAGAAADLKQFRKGQVCLGFQEPLIEKDWVASLATAGVDAFAIELVPRYYPRSKYGRLVFHGEPCRISGGDSLRPVFAQNFSNDDDCSGNDCRCQSFCRGRWCGGITGNCNGPSTGRCGKCL